MTTPVQPKASRSLELDMLRCLAILLVLLNHAPGPPDDAPDLWHWLARLGANSGWIGVDLFFVLSGFLISGLLFREHQQFGRIEFKRFFIRRGFKIYPPLYCLALVSIPLFLTRHHGLDWRRLIGELFFLQNYLDRLWPQTWSLAVEEHFYIALPWLLIFLARRAPDHANPFRVLPKLFAITAGLVLGLRLLTVWRHDAGPMNDWDHTMTFIFPTHLRIDSLFFGVLLSYLHHFHRELLGQWITRNRIWLGLSMVLAIAPALVLKLRSSPFLYTFGFSLLYLGFGALLLLVMHHGLPGRRLGPLWRAGGRIGFYSYSIYLWHWLVRNVVTGSLMQQHHVPWWLAVLVYLVISVGVGTLLGKLVEIPFLNIRDKYFPSRSPADTPLSQTNPSAAAVRAA